MLFFKQLLQCISRLWDCVDSISRERNIDEVLAKVNGVSQLHDTPSCTLRSGLALSGHQRVILTVAEKTVVSLPLKKNWGVTVHAE
jgi:hypothetical protein